jgi:hypothetical protein
MKTLVRSIRRWRIAARVVDALKWWRDPAQMHRLLDDVKRTAGEVAFIRNLPAAVTKGKRVLVLSMSDSPYIVKLEAWLATEFLRRGWQCEVLTAHAYTMARRIFSAFGIHRFIPYEALVWSGDVSRLVVEEVSRRAAASMTFQSVMQWTYRDVWIGPLLLAAVSRAKFRGAPDPTDPATRVELLRQLPDALAFVHVAEKFIEKNMPDVVLVNEPNNYAIGPFVDAAIARGIPVVQFVQPSREDALVFKHLTRETRRIHPNSISRETLWGLLRDMSWTDAHQRILDEEFQNRYGGKWRIQQRNQPGTVDMTPAQVQAELHLDPSKPTAVLFSHVLWDANLFYGKDLFDNYGHWFVESVKAAVANPRVNWLIKLHPANIWKRELSNVKGEYDELRLIRENIGDLPPHVRIVMPDTKISTLSLFQMIDAGITVRGSIGYELPCFGVPVVTAGTGRFSGFGFTIDHESAEDYLRTLATLENVQRLSPDAVRLARIHAYALLVLRPWRMVSMRASIGNTIADPLNQNIHAIAASFGDIARNGDLSAFADWAMDAGRVDYLAPDPIFATAAPAKASV